MTVAGLFIIAVYISARCPYYFFFYITASDHMGFPYLGGRLLEVGIVVLQSCVCASSILLYFREILHLVDGFSSFV